MQALAQVGDQATARSSLEVGPGPEPIPSF